MDANPVIAVVFGALSFVVLCGLTYYFQSRDRFCWEAVKWSDVVQGPDRCEKCGPLVLLLFRLCGAGVVFMVVGVVVTPTGTSQDDRSLINARGSDVLSTWTMWCWLLIGTYFALSASISAWEMLGLGGTDGCFALGLSRLCWALFEVAAASAVMVFTMVWLMLVPGAFAFFHNSDGFFDWGSLMMHNANLVLMLIELLLNRMCFLWTHVIFMEWWGFFYVVFSWIHFWLFGQFVYFFVDFRHWWIVPCYLGLIALVVLFWGIALLTSWCVKGGVPSAEELQDGAGCSPEPPPARAAGPAAPLMEPGETRQATSYGATVEP